MQMLYDDRVMVSALQPTTRISEAAPEQGRMVRVIAPTPTPAPTPVAIEGQPNKTFVESLERNVATQTAVHPIAAENTASANPLTFKPQLMHRDVTNDTGLRKLFQFPLDPLFSNYYTALRAGGYIFNAGFSDLSKGIDKLIKSGIKHKGETADDIDIMYISPDSAHEKAKGVVALAEGKDSSDPAIRRVLYLETVAFTSIAAYYSLREFKNLFENCRLALAAELGKPEEQVTWKDMFNTDNPIISTEANRLAWKTALRLGSGMGYSHRLETGLILAAINISAERTVFFQKTSYDMASEIVNDVQLNHLTGDAAKEDIINGLQRIVQRTTVDHNRTPIREEELRQLRPIFAGIAEDIINKKIGVASVISYLGGGVIIAGNPEQSRVNYEYVKQHGLTHVAADGADLRIRLGIPESQPIWQRYEPEVKEERADVAESAKRARTLTDRYGLDSARAAHLGSSLTR
jgi:hypothetical protein